MRRTYDPAAMALLACILLAACGTDKAGPAVQPRAERGNVQSAMGRRAPGLQLPELAQLPVSVPRHSSYSESDLFHEGAEFEAGLPNSNTVVNGDFAMFSPVGGSGLSAQAFCIYQFTAPGYDRNPQLRISRSINPSNYAESWLALANFSSGRWDYFPDDPDGRIDLADLAPYFNASGDLFVAVIETGAAASELSSLRLGGPAPLAQLSADPASGVPPLSVTLDAAASLAGEGSITRYEWDPEGDGVFETDTGTSASLVFEYSAAGDYSPAVRVSNSLGNQSSASTSVSVSANFKHTIGRAGLELFYDAALAPDNSIYLAGSTSKPSDTSELSLLLVKLNADGSLAWGRSFRAGDDAGAVALEINPAGLLLLAGTSVDAVLGDECLLQAWNQDGDLVWSKGFGSSVNDNLNSIVLSNNNIYLAGSTYDGAGGSSDILLVKADADGAITWSRKRDLGDNEFARLVAMKRTGLSVSGVIVGASQFDGSHNHLWLAEWQPNGDFIAGLTPSDSNLYINIGGLEYVRPDNMVPGTYFIGGNIDVAGTENLFALAMPPSGSSLFGTRFDPGGGVSQGQDLKLAANGDLLLLGYTGTGANSRGILARFGAAAGELAAAERSSPAASAAIPFKMQLKASQVLICGASQQLNYAWESYSPASAALSVTWSAADGTGSNALYSTYDLLGNVSDLSSGLQLDLDDSDYEGLVERRSAP